MPKYRIDYTETVWGSTLIEADSEQEAVEMFETGDCDKIENKSEVHEYTVTEE